MKTLISIVISLSCAGPLLSHPGHQHREKTPAPLHRIAVHGDDPLSHKIRSYQDRLVKDPNNVALIENIGWLFVAKAREETHHQLYAHAIRCAEKLSGIEASRHQGRLMLGHLMLQDHRFTEAKQVAESLVTERGWHYDHGLLGDVLLDLGDTDGAMLAYDAMMRQRPGLESYARAGLIRWHRGQLDGAVEAMQLAISAGSLRNPEPLAWAYTKLAGYHLQKGELDRSETVAREALKVVPAYPHAQLMLGRVLMASDRFPEALPVLEKAANKLPEPALLWALEDCLREMSRDEAACEVAKRMHRTGSSSDARTYALYLATRSEKGERAYTLASNELKQRQDIHTHDALAWAALAKGDLDTAQAAMKQALREGTRDPRLALHAGVIAARTGDQAAARRHLQAAEQDKFLLFPSERELLAASHAHSHPTPN